MSDLHISKVAVGCANLDALRHRQAARVSGGEVPIQTRFRPKRADELIGGSIYWIVRHRVAARQAILGFGEDPDSRKTIIRLCAELVPVAPQPRRAHQGWRYLSRSDAPEDLSAGGGAGLLPPALLAELSLLALL